MKRWTKTEREKLLYSVIARVGGVVGLLGAAIILPIIGTNAQSYEPCTITVDGTEYSVDYGEYYDESVYEEESSHSCYPEDVYCYYEGADLGEWYSNCEEYGYGSCTITIDGSGYTVDYGDYYVVYSEEHSDSCYSEYMYCYDERSDLGEWYSNCEDTKQEVCVIPGTIENGKYTTGLVNVTWNVEINDWNDIPTCTNFTCNSGYHKTGNMCESNIKEGPCELPAGYDENENVMYTTTGNHIWNGNRWIIPVCEKVGCKDGYHKEAKLQKAKTLSNGTTVSYYDNNISYVLNSGFDTEKTFTGVGTITITSGTDTITILDRNLGATQAGTGCEIKGSVTSCPANDPTYGYHFQWGNNYGFNPIRTPTKSSTQVKASSLIYNPLNQEYYSSSTFISTYSTTWYDSIVVDLWGGSASDSGSSYPLTTESAAARRGPCPENFHVPSYGELNKIKTMMGNDSEVTHSELLVPFAMNRDTDGSIHYDRFGVEAHLWSSSPLANYSYGYYSSCLSLNGNDNMLSMSNLARAHANSVRCVHDSYQIYTKVGNLINYSCRNNTKQEVCVISGTIKNGKYLTGLVEAIWNTELDSWDIPVCTNFTCNRGYHKTGGNMCESNTKKGPCELPAGYDQNAIYTTTGNHIWSGDVWIIPVCEKVGCDDGYHKEAKPLSNGTTVSYYDNNISYVLNSGFDTQQTFTGVGTITITSGTDTITILDRNLGATQAGTGCERNGSVTSCPANDPTYGYHFQWGNNYGFDPNSTIATGTTQVQASSLIYNPLNQEYYSSSTFIQGTGNWLRDNSKINLWGGSGSDASSLYGVSWSYPLTAEGAAARRGPCPENFHVPSYGELNKIKTMMGNDAAAAHSELLVPFAGYRNYKQAYLSYRGYDAYLWSSSPYSESSPSSIYFGFVNGNMGTGSNYRANAYSVRCVHDFYKTYPKAGDLITDNYSCENNTKQEVCRIRNTIINGKSLTGLVEVTWNIDTNSWNDISECTFICNSGYHKTGNICESNTKQEVCVISGTIENGKYLTGLVDVTWNAETNNWNDIPACPYFICNSGYYKTGNICETKEGLCNDGYHINIISQTITDNGTTINRFDNDITYTLNSGFDTEQLFTGVGTITIINGRDTITILDRNLGATQAGTGCEVTGDVTSCPANDPTYGYHFQWGNNYGFDPNITPATGYQIFGDIGKPYISSIFRVGYEDWVYVNPKGSSAGPVGLWGGGVWDDDTTYPLTAEGAAARRGPCPENFHVPSYGELNKIKTMIGNNVLHNNLLVPLAGVRNYSGASVYGLGDRGYLWSSSAYSRFTYPYSPYSYLLFNYGYLSLSAYQRANGYSVRCVYDSYDIYNYSCESNTKQEVCVISGTIENGEYMTGLVDVTWNTEINNWNDIPTCADFTCNSGYHKTGNICESDTKQEVCVISGTIENGEYMTGLVDVTWNTEINNWNDIPACTDFACNKNYDKTATGCVLKPHRPSGGGGGGNISKQEETSQSQEILPDDNVQEDTHGSAEQKVGIIEGSEYSDELNEAYQYAYSVGITTMPTIQQANMMGPLLRKHLAKMVSEFAMQELGIIPNTGKVCKFTDTQNEDQEMQYYTELACQLEFMGLHADGITVKDDFNPNDEVTRAEFGTVLSRLLWKTKYSAQTGELYYQRHLEALKDNGIMTQIYGNWPSSTELRGYVMLMLQRVSKMPNVTGTHGASQLDDDSQENNIDDGNIVVTFNKGFKNGVMNTTGDYIHIVGAIDPSRPVETIKVTHSDTKGKATIKDYQLKKYDPQAHNFWFNAAIDYKSMTANDKNTYEFKFYDKDGKLLFKESVVINQKSK